MADDRVRFLKLSTCLWSHKTAPLPIGCGFWSFSLPLPNEVTVTTSGQPSTFRMPESFLERHTRVTVLYEISVAVSRAMFRSDSKYVIWCLQDIMSTRPTASRRASATCRVHAQTLPRLSDNAHTGSIARCLAPPMIGRGGRPVPLLLRVVMPSGRGMRWFGAR